MKGWDKESLRHSAAKKYGKAPPYRNEAKMPAVSHRQIDVGSGTLFKINDKISVVARYEKTRSGFKHVADLYINGNLVDSAKVTYINRTWESYDYETVLKKLIGETSHLSDDEKKLSIAYANIDHSNTTAFKTVAMVAKMGDIFGKSEKEKNEWKTRMLKAGFEKKGLEIPEDWDTLDEKTKKARLDAVIRVLSEEKKGE
jgi:hypothetical protein